MSAHTNPKGVYWAAAPQNQITEIVEAMISNFLIYSSAEICH